MVFSSVSSREVACVVLAAGSSRRMGSHNKLLLPYRGMPMVRQVVLQALASNCTRVMVVVGHNAPEVERALAGLSVQFVHNEDYAQGIGLSVAAGVSKVRDTEGVLICLGDMPRVDAATLNALMDAFQLDETIEICRPRYKEQPGNPILWGPSFLPALSRLRGDVGARGILQAHGAHIHWVNIETDGVLQDVDQPEDLPALGMALPRSKDGVLAS
jgi:molybdenum cofactor cytidylyltransferase